MTRLAEGFAEGYACLSAWADLLDRINVFPVADADTGTNLRISLGPLRTSDGDRSLVAGRMVRGATGNSGNIAAAFFSALLAADSLDDLAARAAEGRARARQAVAEPRDGTMLSVFDRLSEILSHSAPTAATCEPLLQALRRTVLDSTLALPDLRAAGVVDAGALAMYIFFDGFFRTVTGYGGKPAPLLALFPDRLTVAADFHPPATEAFCVDAILQPTAGDAFNQEAVARLGESVVVLAEQSRLKIHIHTTDPQQLRHHLAELGEVVGWSDQSLAQTSEDSPPPLAGGCLHIMTDAAGSLPRDLARHQRITLLDSYILINDGARPESLCDPATIYAALRQGQRVTTAQASLAERQHHYRNVCEQFGPTLYLCVGAAFTGNYGMAQAWQRQQDSNLFEVLDTGAASGRLGLIALLTSRRAAQTTEIDAVRAYARELTATCREYIFIDSLRYLVAGGRVSRAGGWVGDLLHLKPVISPCREGVRRVGMVRNRAAQLDFALDKAATEIAVPAATVLLQYSDNQDWVTRVAGAQLQALLPGAEIRVVPLSLTSGVHTGPGTWALAFAGQD